MKEKQDIRWKQRFQNYEKAIHYLESAIHIEKPDITQKAGIIQFFELSLELSYNLMKDYLVEQGFTDLKYPRESIKKAFEVNLISDGHTWLQMLKNRNLTSHVYDEVLADRIIVEIVHHYYPLMSSLYKKLNPEV